MVSTGNTDAVPRKSVLRSVRQGLGNEVWDILYNSAGQRHIPLRHPEIFPQYASAGRITKSTEDPTGVGGVWISLFLSDTYGGRTHEKPIADATPYPLPAGSRLLQDLGFLACTLPEVEILMPTKTPRGQELTREQHRANQALHQRWLRIEHVNSRVKRCRIVKDRLRLWKQGVRDLVMEVCCALHHVRVRLMPWQPMV
jgi:hypothetical protein